MSEPQKKPGAACWATLALIAVPMLKELSVGPLVGMQDRGLIPARLQPALHVYYIPTNFVYDHAPAPVKRVMHWYVSLFVRSAGAGGL
jgi:hypothetical protein